jgi:hypothetical protein
MNTTTPASLAQRSSAFALALVVTLALLGGLDSLATQSVHAQALLAQQPSPVAASS